MTPGVFWKNLTFKSVKSDLRRFSLTLWKNSFLFLKSVFIFNWRIIAVQCCVGFCHESESESCSVSNFLQPHRLDGPWDSPGQNTGVASLSLHQGIFPTQGSNSGLSHCRQILYQLSHKGSPRILEWVAYPFSSGSSWLRSQTGVSCIAGGFFTNWASREALGMYGLYINMNQPYVYIWEPTSI